MVVLRSVRQVRPRVAAAGPEGLQGSLLRLSLAELYRVPQYRRSRWSRVQRSAGGGARCRIQDQGRSERSGRNVRAARPTRRLLPPTVRERAGGTRGQWRRIAARTVAGHQDTPLPAPPAESPPAL